MILPRVLARARQLALLWTMLPLILLATPAWAWPISNWSQLVLTVTGFAFAFWLGAVAVGAALRPAFSELEARLTEAIRPPLRADWGLHLMLFLAIGLNLLTAAVRGSGFDAAACGASVLACSNAAYQGFVEGQSSGSGVAIEYARIAAAPIIYGAIGYSAWALVVHPRGGPRLLYAGVLLSELSVAILTGTARNFANFILLGFILFALRRQIIPSMSRIRPAVMLSFVVVTALFFSYFAAIQIGREGAVAAVGLMQFGDTFIEAWSFQNNSDNFVLKGLESVVRYLCSGYFSLSVGLEMKAGETFPFGHSLFLARRAEILTDSSHWIVMSIPGQIESAYGWSRLQQWHSIFTWLMSDFGVFGTAIFLMIFGGMFTASIVVALTCSDALSKLPFFLLFLLVLYIPANNQLAQGAETTVAFIFSAALLLLRLAPRIWSRSNNFVDAQTKPA